MSIHTLRSSRSLLAPPFPLLVLSLTAALAFFLGCARAVEKLAGEMPEPVRKAIEGAGLMGPSANRITLVRDANGDGKPEVHETFLAGLNQPFGMLLLGDWLYVANTDALVRFPYRKGQTKI